MSNKWSLHGESSVNQIAAALPAGRVHFIVPTHPRSHEDLVAADLAVAAAAGAHGCTLGTGGANGRRASMAGFFGMSAGAPVAVAVATDFHHAQSMSHGVEAAAAARGVSSALPIAFASTRGDIAAALISGGFAWHDAAARLGRSPQIVIINRLEFGAEGARSRAARGLVQTQGVLASSAIVVVADAVPPELITAGTVIFETDGSALTLVRSPVGRWAKAFDLVAVEIAGEEASAIRPGLDVGFDEAWVASHAEPPAPVAPKPPAPEPEPTVRFAVLPTGRKLSADELAPWAGHRLVTDETAAVPSRAEAAREGLREITIVPSDQDGRNVNALRRAATARSHAQALGVEANVKIVISDRRVRAFA